MREPAFVAARSSRGHLAHAVRGDSKDELKAKFERGETPLASCRGAYCNVLISEHFDTDADEQDGHRSCNSCAQRIRGAEAVARLISEGMEMLRREGLA